MLWQRSLRKKGHDESGFVQPMRARLERRASRQDKARKIYLPLVRGWIEAGKEPGGSGEREPEKGRKGEVDIWPLKDAKTAAR